MEKTYNVVEIFYSLQGEGSHAGRAAIFVRFSKCNRACIFCDEDYSKAKPMTAQQITEEIKNICGDCKVIVLTGGEPCLSIDEPLLDLIKEQGYELHLETNGDFDIWDNGLAPFFDHITVSPKGLPFVLRNGNDLKLVVTADFSEQMVRSTKDWGFFENYYLQPDATNLEVTLPKTIALIKKYPDWRLSVQLHKMIGVE